MGRKEKIAVVGAGMAGLSAAYRLEKAGFDVTVYECDDHVGGRTYSIHKNGFTMDLGAITLSPAYRESLALLDDIGAHHLLKRITPVLAIARNGQFHEIDLAKPIASGIRSGFVSTGAKLRLVRMLPTLAKYWSRCDFENMSQLSELDQENCEAFALRTLGPELHDFLVDPIIRVNMFSSTRTSSAVDLIWLLKMFSGTELIQINGGMGAMSTAVARQVSDLRLGSPVESVVETGQGVVLTVNGQDMNYDAAVLAIPPEQALAIAPWVAGATRDWFDRVEPVQSLAVHVGLKRRPSGRATMSMIPSSESPHLYGIGFEHNKHPDRVPSGKGMLSLHMTHAWDQQNQGLDDNEVARRALAEISSLVGDLSGDMEVVNLHRWNHVDHKRYVGVYRGLEKAYRQFREGRVLFAGEYISAGVEGAVVSGRRCAEALASRY